jgi:hypothetical protein
MPIPNSNLPGLRTTRLDGKFFEDLTDNQSIPFQSGSRGSGVLIPDDATKSVLLIESGI